MPDRAFLSPRRDLTFKHNAGLGRHGWLRLTPAYSVRLVQDILREEEPEIGVLDPYSGTGTTALCASERGLVARATDINPFLIWLGRQKVGWYSSSIIRRLNEAASGVEQHLLFGGARVAPPPLHNIERWWPKVTLDALCLLKGALEAHSKPRSKTRSLLELAFCRTMMTVSSAAYNHQSMSFKAQSSAHRERKKEACERICAHFRQDIASIAAAAAENPSGEAHLSLGDARTLKPIAQGSFDLVVTSPPYPNRMSYVRELRPYMYWLGHLAHAREAGDLDWRAIGGTWGVATSRLAAWEPPSDSHGMPTALRQCLRGIRRTKRQSSEVLARYVHKYFIDVQVHLTAMHERLAPGGKVHYIVGNSSFFGELVPTERIYAHFLRELGFQSVSTRTLRKRNSKRELFEFDVVGCKRN